MGTPSHKLIALVLGFLGLLIQLTWAQHSDDFLVIEAEDGWSIIWDGNDGEHFDAEPPDDGGAQVPDNLALASNGAIPFGTSELDPARWDFHVIPSLNNGTYGNFSSWISADGDEDKFVGIDLGGKFRIGRIAWGRDNGNGAFDDSENAGGDACGGQCDDRWQGDDPYTLQITTVPNPNADTPDSDWETIGTFEYLASADIEPGEGFTPWLRHEYEISRTTGDATEATGVRITVPKAGLGGGTAIDEIEVYGPAGDPRFFSETVDQLSDRPDAQTLRIPVQNRGATKVLTISSAELKGDEAFSLTSFPATLEPFAVGELVVEFDPQGQVGRYQAEIALVSDDEFFPEASVPIKIQVEHANGLIAHYKMDETDGDELVDSSGNNYHGAYVRDGGAVMLGADPLASGTAVRFSGDLAYAEVPPESGLPPLQTFSASLWVNFDPAGAGNFSSFVSKGAELGNPFSLIANVDGPLQFFSGGLENEPTEAVIGADEAHHVVITHEDKNGPKEEGESEVRVYLNGELIFENLEADGFDDRNPSPFQIAATAAQFGMVGTVDDVQLYQIPITPEQVNFLKDNPGRVLPGRPLIIRPADGFAVDWNGNDGEFFDAGAPPDGAMAPDNLALLGTPFSSSDLGPELNIDFHQAHNITDGSYGNANSWISASGDANPFVGVALERPTDVMAVAWGRDNGNGEVDDSAPGTDCCGGQLDDRAGGVYTLQVTSVSGPDANTPDEDWRTVGVLDYRENADSAVGGGFTTFLRHQYDVVRTSGDPLIVSGVRLLVPVGGTAIDEIEIYGIPTGIPVTPAEGYAITFDGNEGERFDSSNAFPNAALAANGAIPFTSGDLGPELNIGFHIVDNVNDGKYGNSNSWISGSEDEVPFLGVDLGGMIDITSVAWGRDNLGQFADRSDGVYELQVTTVEAPNAETPDGSWTTVGTFHYDESIGVQKHLRHAYQVSQADGSPIPATGVRLIVPSAVTAIDELEINPMRGPEPTITAHDGFAVSWDRNDGNHFDATPPPDGALAPDNLALASNGGEAFASGDLGPEIGIDFHVAANVNDGVYGNSNSWIGASGGDAPFFAGVTLPDTFNITAIAWGRDNGNGAFDGSDPGADACGGQCIDRWAGMYELQITTDGNTWTTLATIEYGESGDAGPGGTFTGYLRHEYAVATADGSPIAANGVRIITPTSGLNGGTAIDEIEIYGGAPEPEPDPDLVWDGTDGEFFDIVPPPDGSVVPDNLALAGNGATAFASGELGPQLGIDFHVAANLNDGFYGNSNSWIGTQADVMFAGIDLGGMRQVNAVAWGRDNGNGAVDDSDPGTDACGGQCDDRWQGTYTVQVTVDDTVNADSAWRTVGEVELTANEDTEIGGGLTGFLRHLYTFEEGVVDATGIRIVVTNAAIAIDEIEVYGPAGPPLIAVQDGFAVAYDGNDGVHFDAVAPPEGAVVPDNLALASNGATPFTSSDLGPELNIPFHRAVNINDGTYGNSNSWISASGDENPFIGVSLGGAAEILSIAWGRDNGNGAVDDSDPGSDACGGQCDDRSLGLYTLQVTTAADPSADTPDGDWTTVATFDYTEILDTVVGEQFTSFLRHEYQITQADGSAVMATGVRLLVPTAGGTAIDELEVYGPITVPEITEVSITDGGVGLQLPAVVSYDIEFSTDLLNWTPIATDVSDSYEDSDAARVGAAAGYYRGVLK